jgi:hypothetical protein
MVSRVSGAEARRVASHLLPLLESWIPQEPQEWQKVNRSGARINVHYFTELVEMLKRALK